MNERSAPSGRRRSRVLLGASAAAAVLVLGACGSPKTATTSSGGNSASIVIGASIPLSGTLAGFGSFQKWGYQHAVDTVNAAGGIKIGGTMRKVELKLLDDKSDPNQVSTNTQTLITSDDVDALLGSCTPALVTPGALVADRSQVPFVTGCDPILGFEAAKNWTWAWDIFFSEGELAAVPFQTLKASGATSNGKVAILHDNGPDGVAVGKVWPTLAAQYGYTVKANISFPTDATDLSAAVQQVKATGADIVLVDAVTPQAVSIRKQMATDGFTPKFLTMEKGAEPTQFATALGSLANGATVGGYWDPSFPYPGAKDLGALFQQQTGLTPSQHIADSYTAAKVLLDAMTAAGTTDKAQVNAAIGKTDATYPVGPVQFDAKHGAKLNLAEVQWQNGKTVVVWPADRKTGTLLYPIP